MLLLRISCLFSQLFVEKARQLAPEPTLLQFALLLLSLLLPLVNLLHSNIDLGLQVNFLCVVDRVVFSSEGAPVPNVAVVQFLFQNRYINLRVFFVEVVLDVQQFLHRVHRLTEEGLDVEPDRAFAGAPPVDPDVAQGVVEVLLLFPVCHEPALFFVSVVV